MLKLSKATRISIAIPSCPASLFLFSLASADFTSNFIISGPSLSLSTAGFPLIS